jgi:phenylacetate-CoA ligase
LTFCEFVNFDSFLNVLENYQIEYLESYPSLIFEFLEYLRARGVSIPLKGIMLGSEDITTQQINDLSDYFRCPIVTWYGQSEKVILACSGNTEGAFRVFTSYGYPDLIDQQSGLGEIIGTTFINKALPLIKYRTGDYGKIFKRENGLWLHEIHGRWGKDFIYLNEQKKIPTTAVNLHSAIQSEILFYQLIQNEYGKLHVLILSKKSSLKSPGEIARIIQAEISEKLNGFEITASIADKENQIQRSQRGKMIMLVQNLKGIKENESRKANNL